MQIGLGNFLAMAQISMFSWTDNIFQFLGLQLKIDLPLTAMNKVALIQNILGVFQ